MHISALGGRYARKEAKDQGCSGDSDAEDTSVALQWQDIIVAHTTQAISQSISSNEKAKDVSERCFSRMSYIYLGRIG